MAITTGTDLPDRGELQPRIDIFGEPIVREGAFGPDILSPVYMSTNRNDPVANELVRLNYAPGFTRRQIRGVELEPDEYRELQQRGGKEFKRRLKRLMPNKTWPRMPDELRLDQVKKARRNAFKSARGAIERRADFRQRLREAKAQAAMDRELLPEETVPDSARGVVVSEEELFGVPSR